MEKVAVTDQKLTFKQKLGLILTRNNSSTIIMSLCAFFLGRVAVFQFMNPVSIAFIGNFIGKGYKFYTVSFFTAIGILTKFEGLYFFKYLLAIILLAALDSLSKVWDSELRDFIKAIACFVAVFIPGFLISYVYGRSLYFTLMSLLEGVLVFSLVFILKDGLKILDGSLNKKVITTEQLISLSILLGAIVSGASDVYIGGISVKIILCTFIVMVMSYRGGSTLGTTTGVLLGFILSIAGNTSFTFVGILSIAGMIAGIMKDIGKFGTILGFLVGSTLTALYLDNSFLNMNNLYSIVLGDILFILVPHNFYFNIINLIDSNMDATEDYLDRVKELTVYKLNSFAKSFQKLADTFNCISEKKISLDQNDISRLIDDIADKTCVNCSNKDICWKKNFYNTYQLLFSMLAICEKNGNISNRDIPSDFSSNCLNLDKFIDNVNRTFEIYKNNLIWHNEIIESRDLVSQQLNGVSNIIKNLSQELDIEFNFKTVLEQNLLKELNKNKIEVDSLIILENKLGKYEITLNHSTMPNMKQLISITNKVLNRKMKKEESFKEYAFMNKNNTFKLRLVEEEKFNIATGVSRATKDESRESGDSYSFMSLRDGQSLLALADGMGSGKKAKDESNATIELLEDFVDTGFDKETAIKIINSILVLKSTEDTFSTLDLCFIDLYTGLAEFIKIGASSTFLLRDGSVQVIRNDNLPMGMLNTVDIDVTNKRLKEGDIIVMITDGLTELDLDSADKEEWILKALQNFKSYNPQDISDYLLNEALKISNNKVKDDMTIMASRVWEKV